MFVNAVPGRKDISNNLRETVVAAHQSGEGYKTISSQPELHHCTVRTIIHKWKTFKTALSVAGSEGPGKFTQRSDRAVLRLYGPQVSMLNVKVYKGVIRITLNKNSLFGGLLGERNSPL